MAYPQVSPSLIAQQAENHPILFDWGNARIAPAMLDLANVVEVVSPAWETVTGKSLNVEAAHLGYDWATAVVNMQYLPFALTNLEPGNVQNMLGKIQNSLTTLRQRL